MTCLLQVKSQFQVLAEIPKSRALDKLEEIFLQGNKLKSVPAFVTLTHDYSEEKLTLSFVSPL